MFMLIPHPSPEPMQNIYCLIRVMDTVVFQALQTGKENPVWLVWHLVESLCLPAKSWALSIWVKGIYIACTFIAIPICKCLCCPVLGLTWIWEPWLRWPPTPALKWCIVLIFVMQCYCNTLKHTLNNPQDHVEILRCFYTISGLCRPAV